MISRFKRLLPFSLKIINVFFVCLLTFSLPVQAATNYKVVYLNSTNTELLETDFAPSSGMDHNLVGGGAFDSFASNDVVVNYNIAAPETNLGALGLSDNKLTIKNGNFTFDGDAAAARVTLHNNNGRSVTVNTDNFNFNLTNNTLSLTGGLSQSDGSLYGALFETNDSSVGAGSISGNKVEVTAGGLSDAQTPNLIGGAVRIKMSDRSLQTNAVVTTNDVTIEALPEDPVKSDIFGGQTLTTITGSYGTTTYEVNNTVNNNTVTLKNGTFGGHVTGGAAILSNTTDAAHNASLQGTVSGNQVALSDGTYEGAVVIGGRATLEGTSYGFTTPSSVGVSSNKITISGGDFKDALIIGGATTYGYTNNVLSGEVSGNTVEISGTPTMTGATLIGGYTNGSNTLSDNTLSLKTKGLTVFGVDGFQTYQFDVSGVNSGDTYLTVTHGNGHNNDFFADYEKNIKNGAINVDGATFNWQDDGRPTNLSVGQSIALLKETGSLGLSGTIANNGVQTDIVDGTETYSYKVVQNGNAVNLLHNGLATSGDWNQAVNLSASDFADGDVFMNVGGTLTAPSITVNGNSQATAALTASALDVTSKNTALTVNATSPDQVKFDTINVSGGNSLTKSGSGFYSFDTMTIDGSASTVSGLDAMSTTNTVNLTGGAAPNFGVINLGNGSTLTVSGGTYDFDTFNVYGSGDTLTGDLNAAGKNVNFYLADSMAANDTALTVTGGADLTGSTVKVGITGSSSPLRKTDQVVLVDAASGVTGDPAAMTGVGMQGLFLTYDFDLSVLGNQLLATVTKAGLTEESKAFLEGRAASLAALSEGSDFAAQQAMDSAVAAATAREDKSLALFTAFGGGKSRYKTGSHVDVTGFNALVGLSHAVSIFKADFVLASFLEYGNGSYDSFNSFASGNIKGSGDTEYMGLGVLIHYMGAYGTYVDTSLRGGTVSTDFKGNVFFADRAAKYDYDSFYFGGHFGLGWLYEASEDFKLDLYARYLLTRQEGKNVTISSGDRLHFDSTLSSRVRVGARADFLRSGSIRPYLGAALDYELDGKAKATAYDMSWDAPSLKGASGVGEAGISWLSGNWTFSAGAEGYVGQRQGIRGNLQVGYQF